MKVSAKNPPSQQFIDAIVFGYKQEAYLGKPVTPSAIWDHVATQCMRVTGGFKSMFAWDKTKETVSVNRIGTIMECIEGGWVPELKLERNGRGVFVVEDILWQPRGD